MSTLQKEDFLHILMNGFLILNPPPQLKELKLLLNLEDLILYHTLMKMDQLIGKQQNYTSNLY